MDHEMGRPFNFQGLAAICTLLLYLKMLISEPSHHVFPKTTNSISCLAAKTCHNAQPHQPLLNGPKGAFVGLVALAEWQSPRTSPAACDSLWNQATPLSFLNLFQDIPGNVNPGLINPYRLFNWEGTIKKYHIMTIGRVPP